MVQKHQLLMSLNVGYYTKFAAESHTESPRRRLACMVINFIPDPPRHYWIPARP